MAEIITAVDKNSFPVWPEKVFAEACIETEWEGYKAEPLPILEILRMCFNGEIKHHHGFEVFPTPIENGRTVSNKFLLEELTREQSRGGK